MGNCFQNKGNSGPIKKYINDLYQKKALPISFFIRLIQQQPALLFVMSYVTKGYFVICPLEDAYFSTYLLLFLMNPFFHGR